MMMMMMMIKYAVVFFVLVENITSGCLITNCPRGGKRNGKFHNALEANIKPCISCGPGRTGQCFGANICCGPFGCLMGTTETLRCQREGFFHEAEPCVAGNSSCRKNTGRCATDGVCCGQESCHVDKTCSSLLDEKTRLQDAAAAVPIDVYNLLSYRNQLEYSAE